MALKLDIEPALQGESSALIRWARRVASVANSLVDLTATHTSQIATLNANTSGPAFSAYLSGNQSIAANTLTYAHLDTLEFDTHSAFNTASWAFIVPVAGFYHFSANLIGNYSGTPTDIRAQIWRNGVQQAYTLFVPGSGLGYATATLSKPIPCSVGDSIQLVGYLGQSGGTVAYLGGYGNTNFSGFFARHL